MNTFFHSCEAKRAGSGPLPMLTLPSTIRNNLVAAIGEFVGTFLFLFFAFAGTQVANMSAAAVAASPGSPPDPTTVTFISLCFGLSLMANVWAFYRVTGGLFNPCVSTYTPLHNQTPYDKHETDELDGQVTLALFLVGGLPATRCIAVVIAQLLGGIAAAGVVSGLFPGPLAVNTTLGGNASVVQGLFIEMFLTAELVFVIIMVAVEKHKSTYLAPVAIGVAFTLAELVGVFFTGGSLNPARSLGPAVVNGSFPGYFWIYWVGPALGAILACGFYVLLKWLRWRECNPGQDWDDIEKLQAERPYAEPEDKAAAATPSPETGRRESSDAVMGAN
ncbi:aquaporin-like protein [Rhypophila decipiens]|uniref:Aquaporin-like protein n=1 Tax=Rhypophila decipiens TaxID=261697 RepID=A0AAN6XWK3_9PEZI|nr:aquaporin-like protein [Rhypophila decipiens]